MCPEGRVSSLNKYNPILAVVPQSILTVSHDLRASQGGPCVVCRHSEAFADALA